jgi:alkaline phosphatase
MSYVVFETATTRFAGKKAKYNDPIFPTMAAAKSHMTRLVKSGKYTAEQIAVADYSYFHDEIEAIVERTNIMSGQVFYERIKVPYYCSPSSETYWSM